MHVRTIGLIVMTLLASVSLMCSQGLAANANTTPNVTINSPNGSVVATLSLAEDNLLTYEVKLKNRPVLEPSALGIIVDGQNLGQNVVLGTPAVREINETY